VYTPLDTFEEEILHAEKMAKPLARIGLRFCIAGTLVLQSLVIPPARANVFDFDPLQLGHASDNILQSVERIQLMLDQVGSLEKTTNADLANRISQVKDVVDEVIAAVNQNAANLREIIAEADWHP
jgi:hypothetical protein